MITFALFMGFKEKYAIRRLIKLAGKANRELIMPDINTSKSVGVVWQPSQKEAYNFLREYFKKDQVIFRGYCVFDEFSNPQPNSNTFTTNDLNWWGLPQKGKVDDFINIKFDILFNIGLEQNFILDWLTALSLAKFKVGWSPNADNYFDLNINIGENEDSLYLAKQQIFYLGELNKKSK